MGDVKLVIVTHTLLIIILPYYLFFIAITLQLHYRLENCKGR